MSLTNRPILVVDDDPEIVRALQVALTHAGYEVRIANNVAAALDAVQVAAPAIVFLDYFLAGEQPGDFVKSARAVYPSMPIVLMTGASDAHEKAKSIGLAFYLPKPFELTAISEVLRRCMGRPTIAAFQTGSRE